MSTVTEEPAAPAPAPSAPSVSGTVRGYFERVRGGDVGALPALLSLVVLVIVFASASGDRFTKAFNFSNLLHQGAAVIIISMGLVFVLLLGEIDLSAGYTGGVSAAVMANFLTDHHWSWWTAVIACLVTGAVIGAFLGSLVAYLGIPSFVVTLAAFLGLQGVLLRLVGEGGTIPVRNDVIVAINNKNMPVWLGWALYVVIVGGYAAFVLRRSMRRRSRGLPAQPVQVLIAKVVVLAIVLGLATYYLSIERSPNPENNSIKGVPQVVLLMAVLWVILTWVLSRTSFGRHVYAVGGNTEAARRAGINTRLVKLTCFMVSSTMAAIGGIMLASYSNSVSPNTGGADTLLYAVGAAVIGGTSLFGGKGRVLDAILGGLVIAVIINGMLLLNKPSSTVYMVTGIVLLVAASVDAISRRRAVATGRG